MLKNELIIRDTFADIYKDKGECLNSAHCAKSLDLDFNRIITFINFVKLYSNQSVNDVINSVFDTDYISEIMSDCLTINMLYNLLNFSIKTRITEKDFEKLIMSFIAIINGLNMQYTIFNKIDENDDNIIISFKKNLANYIC